MQDAVNPIESLDTWTEFVEGKNKVPASHATDRQGRGDGGGAFFWPSWFAPGLQDGGLAGGRPTSCCFPNREAEIQGRLARPWAPAAHRLGAGLIPTTDC